MIVDADVLLYAVDTSSAFHRPGDVSSDNSRTGVSRDAIAPAGSGNAVCHGQREGLAIAEIPITFTDRREGQSKMSRKGICESVLMPWRLRFSSRDEGGRTPKDEGGRMKDEVKADAG